MPPTPKIPSSPSLDAAIREILDATVAELATAVRASILVEVQRLVGGAGVYQAGRPAAARAAAPAPTAPSSRPPRRGVAAPDLARVLEHVKANPGMRAEQIRAALGIDAGYGAKILAKLRETKALRTKGQKRATAYFVG